MDKGKKPIQEEETGFPSLKNYHPNVASSSSKPPLMFETPFEDSDSEELIVVLNEIEKIVVDDEDEFFFEFSTIDSADDSPAETKKSPVTSSSSPAAAIVVQPDNKVVKEEQVVDKGTVVSALSANLASASMGNPYRHSRAIPPLELENIAKTDPKRAKKIITNRRSAMKAKEKKKLHASMLEHKFQKLNSDVAQASARMTLLLTEQKSLTYENSKLKDHEKFAMKMVDMQESKNDDIRKEVQFYKLFLARQKRAAMHGNVVNVNISVNAAPSMAAGQGLNLQSRSTRMHRRLQHGFQQQRAGQHPNQARQPQQSHQNNHPMCDGWVWLRHVRD